MKSFIETVFGVAAFIVTCFLAMWAVVILYWLKVLALLAALGLPVSAAGTAIFLGLWALGMLGAFAAKERWEKRQRGDLRARHRIAV